MLEELGSAASHAAASAGPVVRAAQVTSLALCKHNKNDLLLVKLRRHVRHGRARSMFWRYNEVPKEALAVLEVRPLVGNACASVHAGWQLVCWGVRQYACVSGRLVEHFHCYCL